MWLKLNLLEALPKEFVFKKFSLTLNSKGVCSMSHAKSLTRKIQAKRTPLILERDYPNSLLEKSDPDYAEQTCCYCEQRFMPKNPLYKKTFEHLDNDNTNQELWNLAWAHWKCNQDKKNTSDLQIQAKVIISHNQQWEENHSFDSLKERDKTVENDDRTETEMQESSMPIVERYLAKNLTDDKDVIHMTKALDSIAFLIYKATGHGSQQTVRRYINMLTSDDGKYERRKIEGKTFILRRSGN